MKKALIISANAIGDAYLSASAIPFLKDHFNDPESEIHFVCSDTSEFLVEQLDVKKIFSVKSKNVFALLNLLFNIRDHEYDIMLCPFPGRVNTMLYTLCKGLKKAGFINFEKMLRWDDKDAHLYIDGRATQKIWKSDQNFLERIKLCLEGVGIIPDKPVMKLKFPLLEENNSVNNNYALCHFNSRIKQKNIDQELFYHIIRTITNQGMDIKLLDLPSYLNFVPDMKIEKIDKASLKNLIDLIQNCSLFIGVDSFPIHIADAYEKKIIGLFRASNSLSILSNDINKSPIDINQDKQTIYQQFESYFLELKSTDIH